MPDFLIYNLILKSYAYLRGITKIYYSVSCQGLGKQINFDFSYKVWCREY